eukprot:s2628_g7.t1
MSRLPERTNKIGRFHRRCAMAAMVPEWCCFAQEKREDGISCLDCLPVQAAPSWHAEGSELRSHQSYRQLLHEKEILEDEVTASRPTLREASWSGVKENGKNGTLPPQGS